MKKLLLIRHAKAVHDNSYDDFERPLKNAGTQDAMMMAERIESEGIAPDILVASPSLRTLSTANIFAEHLQLPKPAEDKRIYEGSLQTLLSVINQLPDDHHFIGLVGHNPGISELLHYLAGEFRDVSPGTAMLINFEADSWKMISGGAGTLAWFGSPKDN